MAERRIRILDDEVHGGATTGPSGAQARPGGEAADRADVWARAERPLSPRART